MKSLLVVSFALIYCTLSASAQQRGPSTPEERARAVEMATHLEKAPLAKDAKDIRTKLFLFLATVPDISIKICSNVLGESKQLKGDYHPELVSQLMFSQAKFIIEQDKAQDDAAVYLAGVEGVLRTWQAIKTAKPKAKYPWLDELLLKQQAGTLAVHVNSAMPGCKQ